MSTVLSGPTADLGVQMKLGVEAAFAEVNRAGGVRGRFLELKVLDDGYEPQRTAPNMRELIEREGVLGIIGNVGTPTAVAALPIAAEHGVLFYGALSGAGILRRTPADPNVFNVRASYAEETGAMVDALLGLGELAPADIALFTQRDAFGDSGFAGARAALIRRGMDDDQAIVHGRYERNTTAVEDGLAEILMAEPMPRAVILVGTYEPCAKFARLAREYGLDSLFLAVSFVGAAPFGRAAGAAAEGTIVTQVVPHPASDLPFVVDYRRALAQVDPDRDGSFGSLEGYLAGRLLCLALEGDSGEPSRASLAPALLGLGRVDLGLGTTLRFRPEEHQALHQVWPVVIRAGNAVSMDWAEIRSMLPKRVP